MAYPNLALKQRAAGETMRRDAWWTQPLFVFLGLSTFIVYSTWAAFQGANYWLDQNGADYLSPFYSPEIFGGSPHAFFGAKPVWWPSWLLFSPRFSGTVGSGRLSPHLLLLSWRLLQSVLGGPASVRRGRTTKRVSRRDLFSADHAEHSPLLPLHRLAVHPRTGARRMESNVVQR